MPNKVKPLNPSAQLALRNRARAELMRLEGIFSNEKEKQMIDNFKDKFSICEIVYKVILEDHQYNKHGIHKDRLRVSMVEAPYALKYAGYDFDKDLLSNLFGSKKDKGSRSVKVLRDLLTHKINRQAVDELRKRESELHGYMDSFLNTIREFDAANAA